jgi:hypothetical protein
MTDRITSFVPAPRAANSFPLSTNERAVAVRQASRDPGPKWKARAQSNVINARSDLAARTVLTRLRDSRFTVHKPLPVVIEYVADDEYIATFEPGEISIAGESVRDAIEALQSELAALYVAFSREVVLGPLPSKRLAILREYIGETGR